MGLDNPNNVGQDIISKPPPAMSRSPALIPLEDVTELEPLPPSKADSQQSPSPNSNNINHDTISIDNSSSNQSILSNGNTHYHTVASPEALHPTTFPVQTGGNTIPSAQYVTISAVLSRSGALVPLNDDLTRESKDILGHSRSSSDSSRDNSPSEPTAGSTRTRRKTQRKPRGSGISSGNALEALGALWLHRDSKGRATSLSLQRWNASSSSSSSSSKKATSHDQSVSQTYSYRAFMKAIRDVGATTLGLNMPSPAFGSQNDSNGSSTIAERRARKRLEEDGDIVGQDGDTVFVRVKGRRNQPTFEVSTSKPPSPKPLSQPSRKQSRFNSQPIADPRAAFRRVHSHAASDTYGMGSAFGPQDPPTAPPSPVGMPGDWPGGRGWSSLANSGHEDAALLLPPPLLDDHGSSPQSFESLLGMERRRKQEEARKRLQRLAARNRPAHKAGLLTALSNFVKAAHAADQAAKVARQGHSRPGGLLRRHTESLETFRRQFVQPSQRHTRESSAGKSGSSNTSTDHSPVLRARASHRNSLVEATDPMFEPLGTVLEGQTEPSDARSDSHPPPVSTTRRSSIVMRNELFQPHAPRLLPIQLLGEPSPFSPHQRGDTTDYLSARSRMNSSTAPSLPHTPQIGPTMLDLPPSPWSSLDIPQDGMSFSLSLAANQLAGLPGTPRLAPTHLSVMPSPFPSAAPSRVGSPPLASMYALSPLKQAANGSSSLASPPFQPLDEDSVIKSLDSEVSVRRQASTSSAKRRRGSRLTPANLFASDSSAETQRTVSNDKLNHGKPNKDENEDSYFVSTDTPQHLDADEGQHSGPIKADTNECDRLDSAVRRSFLLWWFVGDLGLGARSTIENRASDPQNSPAIRLLWLACSEILSFLTFCLVHFVSVLHDTAHFLSVAFWFLRWVLLNLLGQTILSRCAIEAYRLIRAEWELVAAEDHEDRQSQTLGTRDSKKVRGGLSKWQVCRGILEIFCLQAVTRDRWMREGAGLNKLEGWQKVNSRDGSGAAPAGHNEADESSDSDDEETDLIITRRDADILEFARTPRLRPKTGSSADGSSGGYFADSRGATSLSEKTTPSQRSLVKKLKWASRLAIGAYGLHVHIVDLPPTFTPSGNRFSRQTFAHLSRLSNPDDVLHAEIQQMTGDEAPYQPTFYVARDHVRKMIVVAVRGTQSFSDIIADLDMRTERFPLPDSVEDAAQLTCHAGILRAAQGLIKADSTLFTTVSRALSEHEGFGLTLVGHSLGAAIASAVVLMLGHYAEQDVDSGNESGVWQIREGCGLPAGRPIQAISLGSPATFSAALSARAAMGKVPLVTSIVLGADIIPRVGHGQARELRRVLGALSRVRRRLSEKQKKRRLSITDKILSGEDQDVVASRRGSVDDTALHEDARVHVLRSWWKWRSLNKKSPAELSRSERHHKDRIESQLWKLRCDVEADLYTVIKARASASDGTHKDIPPSPWVGPRSSAPLHQLGQRRQALDSATLQSEAALGGVLMPAGKCIYMKHTEQPMTKGKDNNRGDGKASNLQSTSYTELYHIESPASFFSLPDFVPSLFADHLPASYEAVIEEL
ncbi:unnamed protein product [Sympodiomycopsis kandeliae]